LVTSIQEFRVYVVLPHELHVVVPALLALLPFWKSKELVHTLALTNNRLNISIS